MDEIESICHHEAGHAVIAYILGFKTNRIRLNKDGGGDHESPEDQQHRELIFTLMNKRNWGRSKPIGSDYKMFSWGGGEGGKPLTKGGRKPRISRNDLSQIVTEYLAKANLAKEELIRQINAGITVSWAGPLTSKTKGEKGWNEESSWDDKFLMHLLAGTVTTSISKYFEFLKSPTEGLLARPGVWYAITSLGKEMQSQYQPGSEQEFAGEWVMSNIRENLGDQALIYQKFGAPYLSEIREMQKNYEDVSPII